MSGVVGAPLSDVQTNQVLGIVRRQIQLTLTSSAHIQPGQTVTATVIPSVPEIDVSELANGVLNLAWIAKDVLFDKKDPVKVPSTSEAVSGKGLDGDEIAASLNDIVAGQPLLPEQHINLAFTAKDVIFKKPDPVDVPNNTDVGGGDDLLAAGQLIAGGQPLQPPLAVPGLPNPTAVNVPGTIGQIFGGINLPAVDPNAPLEPVAGILNQIFGTLGLPNIKVQMKVKWIVRDANGNDLQESRDFIALEGLTSPTVSLVLPPVFRELRLDTLQNPGGSVVCLTAAVTLMLGAKTLNFELPSIPVLVLPLLVPTIVVLFNEPNFGLAHDSAALIIVPEHSPLAGADSLFKLLKKLETVTSALRGLGKFVNFFLGLDELLGSVPEQPRLRFVSENEIPILKNIIIKRRPWYKPLGDDPNFDNKISSLMIFGLPGTKVQFFGDDHFKRQADGTNQGNYDVELQDSALDPDLFVAVRTLETIENQEPRTFPPGRVVRFEADTHGDLNNWAKDMSSVRFDTNWIANTQKDSFNPVKPPALVCYEKGGVFDPPARGR